MVKLIVLGVRSLACFLFFLIASRLKMVSSQRLLPHLATLHTVSGGVFTSIARGIERFLVRRYRAADLEQIDFSPVDARFSDLKSDVSDLGYSVVRNYLPKNVFDEVCSAAEQFRGAGLTKEGIWVRNLCKSEAIVRGDIIRLDYLETDLRNLDLLMDFANSAGIRSLATSLLGAPGIIDTVRCWRSFCSSNVSSLGKSVAAQEFHFDMDRISWIKLFFYLTDCNSLESGPHAYIPRSKKFSAFSSCIPQGYVRWPNDVIHRVFGDTEIVLFGSARDMIIGDTLCLHRGYPVQSGERLMLEIQYSLSGIGSNNSQGYV